MMLGASKVVSLEGAVSPAVAGLGLSRLCSGGSRSSCVATRAYVGCVIIENVSETLTELDVRRKKGVMPRLDEK